MWRVAFGDSQTSFWREHGKPFPRRLLLSAAVHLVFMVAAYGFAFLLRFDFSVPSHMQDVFLRTLPWIVVVKVVVFYRVGSFHGWWRYITFADLDQLIRATIISTTVIAMIDYFFVQSQQIPRTVLILDCGITILLFGGLRSMPRFGREHIWSTLRNGGRQRALMIIRESGAEETVHLLHNHPRLRYRIVGLLTNNPRLYGTRLGGIPFLDNPLRAVACAKNRSAGSILVMSNSLIGQSLRDLMAECHRAEIELKIIPDLENVVDTPFCLPVRDVNIEDLLRRKPVDLDGEAIRSLLADRSVMVTGAGGSIGSEICRQVLRYGCRLILVDRAENSLFHIEQELLRDHGSNRFVPCIADICDEERMRWLYERHRPSIVFHAAAHKHVPMMERNPGQAIYNNVLGTECVAKLAHEYSVARFVMISSDKAVNPSSVMGATKQLAETYVHAMSSDSATKFVVVRFGNVLASVGSVVPIFREQIQRGGPVTVTHPDMKRYFMTIPEAAQLVLQAAAMGKGGEIFVLDMGDPVKIMDLAADMIRQHGYSLDEIGISTIGPRPGEKLFEELYFHEETSLETQHPKIRAAFHRPIMLSEVNHNIAELKTVIHAKRETVYQKLREFIPDFCPAAMTDNEPVLAQDERTAEPCIQD